MSAGWRVVPIDYRKT